MTITLRILRRFRDEIAADLHRGHAFAAERVGFVLARWSRAGDHLVVLPYEYLPVADEHYVDDPTVGFRIDERAIRAALQATLDARAGCLHVHAHDPVMPYFGALDLVEQRALMPSFVGVARDAPHGALLLTGDAIATRIWVPGGPAQIKADRVMIVGHPLAIQQEPA